MGKTGGKAKRKQSASGLGRSLMKSGQVGGRRHENAEVARTLKLTQDRLEATANENQFDSVVERGDLAEFVEMAKLSNKDFQPQQRGPVILSSVTKTALKEPTQKELDLLRELHEHRLKVPRRPKWSKGMQKQEIQENEKAGFLQWRRDLAEFEEVEGMCLTPFEKNLEMWRQLWRVVERSDVVVQVLDCRNPLLFRCPDFEQFVREVDPIKRNVLLLNKADLLSLEMREAWAGYLQSAGIRFMFWSALLQNEENERAQAAEKAAEKAAEQDSRADDDDDDFAGAAGGGGAFAALGGSDSDSDSEEEEEEEEETTEAAEVVAEPEPEAPPTVRIMRRSSTGGGPSSAEVEERPRSDWYGKAAAYWDEIDATVDGVLGGFGDMTGVDLRDSHAFFARQGRICEKGAVRPGTLACDCGAGIGRVSEGLLLDYCEKVDIVEQCQKYTDAAREYVGMENIRNVYTQGLQDFMPEEGIYDIVWIQWVIGHLGDEDFIEFFQRCVASLKPGGFLGMKENNATEAEVTNVDEEDSSVTRSDTELRRLFAAAGLQVVDVELQTDFPEGMFEIRMYALEPQPLQPPPLADGDGATATAAAEEEEAGKAETEGDDEEEDDGSASDVSGTEPEPEPSEEVELLDPEEAAERARLAEEAVWSDWDPVHVHNGEEVMTRLAAFANAANLQTKLAGGYVRDDGRVTIGMVGCPNVGKSTTVNALCGGKKVAVAETPGKTKHFQTIVLDEKTILCDCPGLVFPTLSGSKAELVVSGILRIDEMRDAIGPINLLCKRIPRAVLEHQYGINLPIGIDDDPNAPPQAHAVMSAFAQARGFMTTGRPDESRAARVMLKDYMNGRVLYAHPPPGGFLTPQVAATRVDDAQEIADGARPQVVRSRPAVYANMVQSERRSKKGKRRERAIHDTSGGHGVKAHAKGKGKHFANGFAGAHGAKGQDGESFTRARSGVQVDEQGRMLKPGEKQDYSAGTY
jgi:ribosome biogenesis GTPase A